jgi:hypothetical protein
MPQPKLMMWWWWWWWWCTHSTEVLQVLPELSWILQCGEARRAKRRARLQPKAGSTRTNAAALTKTGIMPTMLISETEDKRQQTRLDSVFLTSYNRELQVLFQTPLSSLETPMASLMAVPSSENWLNYGVSYVRVVWTLVKC